MTSKRTHEARRFENFSFYGVSLIWLIRHTIVRRVGNSTILWIYFAVFLFSQSRFDGCFCTLGKNVRWGRWIRGKGRERKNSNMKARCKHRQVVVLLSDSLSTIVMSTIADLITFSGDTR